jgi:hypothetical protein
MGKAVAEKGHPRRGGKAHCPLRTTTNANYINIQPDVLISANAGGQTQVIVKMTPAKPATTITSPPINPIYVRYFRIELAPSLLRKTANLMNCYTVHGQLFTRLSDDVPMPSRPVDRMNALAPFEQRVQEVGTTGDHHLTSRRVELNFTMSHIVSKISMSFAIYNKRDSDFLNARNKKSGHEDRKNKACDCLN